MRTIVQVIRDRARQASFGPTAVLVDSDLCYGMLRMLELLLDDLVVARPFRDVDEATTWLRNMGPPLARKPT